MAGRSFHRDAHTRQSERVLTWHPARVKDDLGDVWRAPTAWGKHAGVGGSQRPLWMMFVMIVGAIIGIADFVADRSLVNGLFAGGCVVGAVVIDGWLVRWYRQGANN